MRLILNSVSVVLLVAVLLCPAAVRGQHILQAAKFFGPQTALCKLDEKVTMHSWMASEPFMFDSQVWTQSMYNMTTMPQTVELYDLKGDVALQSIVLPPGEMEILVRGAMAQWETLNDWWADSIPGWEPIDVDYAVLQSYIDWEIACFDDVNAPCIVEGVANPVEVEWGLWLYAEPSILQLVELQQFYDRNPPFAGSGMTLLQDQVYSSTGHGTVVGSVALPTTDRKVELAINMPAPMGSGDPFPGLNNDFECIPQVGKQGLPKPLLAAEGASSISMYPNPASDWVMLRHTPTNDGPVSMEIWDASGRLIKALRGGQGEAGIPQSRHLSLNDLAPGMYTVRVRSGSGVEVKPLQVLR